MRISIITGFFLGLASPLGAVSVEHDPANGASGLVAPVSSSTPCGTEVRMDEWIMGPLGHKPGRDSFAEMLLAGAQVEEIPDIFPDLFASIGDDGIDFDAVPFEGRDLSDLVIGKSEAADTSVPAPDLPVEAPRQAGPETQAADGCGMVVS